MRSGAKARGAVVERELIDHQNETEERPIGRVASHIHVPVSFQFADDIHQRRYFIAVKTA
jgi:hypothetical protein